MALLPGFSLRSPIEAWVQFFLIGTLLFFPMSSSAKSIFLGLSVISILFLPGFRADLMQTVTTPWCRAALSLFVIALVFCCWSPASLAQKEIILEKYSKLLYLPILVIGFQNRTTRQLSIQAFLTAMFTICCISILKFYGYLGFLSSAPDNLFRNHIMISIMVAFAAYLSFLWCLHQQRYARIAYALLALVFSYHILFVNGSRTGYIIYLVLMSLLALQMGTWRQSLAGLMAIGSIFCICYFNSPVMKSRVDGIVDQFHGYHHNNRNTDLGMRLQFHDYAHELFNKHPILGNGTASFTYYFDKEKPIPVWDRTLLEPHSQYWLVASEFGLVGLIALLYFFFCLIQTSFKLHKMKIGALALMLLFLIGNLSDSLLFYSGSGYFFIFFMAIFLGEELENKKTI